MPGSFDLPGHEDNKKAMSMRIVERVRSLWRREEGAVTVDWVVLTAVVSGLGMAVAYTLWVEIGTANNNIVVYVDAQSIKTTF